MLKYTLKKLNNGLTVLIITTPNLAHLDATLYIKVGSVDENKINNGISHLLEHILFLNTKKTELEPINLEVYPFTNKFFTHFEITSHKDFATKALEALFSAISKPEFTKDNLQTVKRIVLEEMLSQLNDPEEIINQKIDEFLYKRQSLSLRVIGTKKTIGNITLDDLKKWYLRYYNPSNMILTVVGDIDPGNTIKQIKKIFRLNPSKPKKTEKKKPSAILTQSQ